MKLTESREKIANLIVYTDSSHQSICVSSEIADQILQICEKEASEKMELLVKRIIEEIDKHALIEEAVISIHNVQRIPLQKAVWWQALKDKILEEIGGDA